MDYELRERVARIEVSVIHLTEMMRQHGERLGAKDERLRNTGQRIARLESEAIGTAKSVAKLTKTSEHLKKSIDRSQLIMDLLRYAAAGIILLLAILGKGDMGMAVSIVAKVLGAG